VQDAQCGSTAVHASAARATAPDISLRREEIMLRILLATDGSESALRATRELIGHAALYKEALHVELLTVRPALHIGRLSGVVVSHEMLESYYREEGEKALAACRQLLKDAGIDHAAHVLVGEIAPTIVEQAKNWRCRFIYMGTRGMAAIPSLVLGSVSTKVLHLSSVPVVLVP
jgi:nucleotide-binding universal stress UspA family protein